MKSDEVLIFYLFEKAGVVISSSAADAPYNRLVVEQVPLDESLQKPVICLFVGDEVLPHVRFCKHRHDGPVCLKPVFYTGFGREVLCGTVYKLVEDGETSLFLQQREGGLVLQIFSLAGRQLYIQSYRVTIEDIPRQIRKKYHASLRWLLPKVVNPDLADTYDGKLLDQKRKEDEERGRARARALLDHLSKG